MYIAKYLFIMVDPEATETKFFLGYIYVYYFYFIKKIISKHIIGLMIRLIHVDLIMFTRE